MDLTFSALHSEDYRTEAKGALPPSRPKPVSHGEAVIGGGLFPISLR